MGLFGRLFGGADGRSDQARRNQQDAGDRFAQSINKHGAQRDPESISAANDLAARAKRLVAEIRFEEAEPLLRQSLAIFEGACGPNHPRVAEALCDLAKVLQDCDEAEALYRRSLAIAEGAFGPDHPNVVIPLHGMAVSLEVLSFRYQEAETLYRRCLAISEAAYGPDDPKVAQIMERIAATLELQSRYEEAESLYRRSLAIMEGALGPDHPNVARTRKELATLSNKSHGTGLLRREGGKKYLRIDGAHAVVHACSTVEGYLERYANDGVGNIELKWFMDGAIESSRPERPTEQQECCYCGTSFEIEPRFPNTSVDVECPHCGRGQAFYVIQMTAGLEQDLGMENRLGNGYATIWLTVPLQHPEFSTLLTKHGVVTWKSPHRSDLPDEMVQQDLIAAGLQYTDTWQNILWFDRFKDQEEMQWYRETLSGVETLVIVSTIEEREANEIVVSYDVSSFEPHEHLDTDGCYITGRVHSGTRTVNASPSDLDDLDDFPRSQVWDREKTADFINRSAENNYQLSDGRYVPEAYSTMLRIVQGAGFRFAIYKEGTVELWSEVATAGRAGFVPKEAGTNTRELNELLLHALDHGGDADAIGDLLARGANPNQRYDDGCSVLYVAAELGYSCVASLLIDAGADINLDHEGATPLHIAAQEGQADIIRLLVSHGANVNAIGPSGASPLWLAVRHAEVCEALITAGADADQPHPEKGFTPLCYAAEIGSLETAKVLISAGADVNYCVTDEMYYYSPLAFAIGSTAVAGHDELQEGIDMIGLLARNGAQFEDAGYPTTPPGGRLTQMHRVDTPRCDGRTTASAKRLLEQARLAGLSDLPGVLDEIAAMDRADWS